MANTEYLELVNGLRERLSLYGINADDEDTKTLKGCQKLLAAIDEVVRERQRVAELSITRSYLSKATGMDRSTLIGNPTYDAIFKYHMDNPDAKPREAPRKGRTVSGEELAKIKRALKDLEDQVKGFLPINEKLIRLQSELEDERREGAKVRMSLRQANDRVNELEKELNERNAVIQRLSGQSRS